MICPSCSTDNEAGRAFCQSCGAALKETAEVRPVTAGRMDDVQQVELARIPTVMHAPTAWTIAKGVFLGLLLWSVFSAAVAFTFFAIALRSTDDGGEVLDVPAFSDEEPTFSPPTSCACDE